MSDSYSQPRTRKEGLSAVNMRRNTGESRVVVWHHIKTRAVHDTYPINVKQGNSLLIRVFSGIPWFIVESGHVTVEFCSTWGNSLKIRPGASAHVIVPEGYDGKQYKVTIENEGVLTVDAPEQNRVRVYGPGEVTGADFPKGIFGALIDAAREP